MPTTISFPFDDVSYPAAYARAALNSMIGNGYAAGVDEELVVIASSPAAMTVEAQPGIAWVQGAAYSIVEGGGNVVLAVGPNTSGSTRHDRVVLRLDFTAETLGLVLKQGTTSPPALQRDTDAYELSLADIAVADGATSIASGDITDERPDFSVCGQAITRAAIPLAAPGLPTNIGRTTGVVHRSIYNASGTSTATPAAGRQFYITEVFGLGAGTPGAQDIQIGGKPAFGFAAASEKAVLPVPILVDTGVAVLCQTGFGVRLLDVPADVARVGLVAQLDIGTNYVVPANKRLVILGAYSVYTSRSYLRDSGNSNPWWMSPVSYGAALEYRVGRVDAIAGGVNALPAPVIVPTGRTLVYVGPGGAGTPINLFGYLEAASDTWAS